MKLSKILGVFSSGLIVPFAWGEIYEERNGLVAVEAEHYISTEKENERSWNLTSVGNVPDITPDPDGPHLEGASGNAYMEILPDTRVTHADPLVNGVSFSNNGGQTTIINYQVYFNTPGRYKVWVRAYSAGSEDNGVHVGIDGEWPDSGERIQWCSGKNAWTWSGAQRTDANHCGEAGLISLEVEDMGLHTISFSQREDGFEMDKWIMVQDENYQPEGVGPDELVWTDITPLRIRGVTSYSQTKLWMSGSPFLKTLAQKISSPIQVKAFSLDGTLKYKFQINPNQHPNLDALSNEQGVLLLRFP